MKMKMKVKYIAKVKSMPSDEEINAEVRLEEERIPDMQFVYNFLSNIEYAESF
jgi:hypothetical protein